MAAFLLKTPSEVEARAQRLRGACREAYARFAREESGARLDALRSQLSTVTLDAYSAERWACEVAATAARERRRRAARAAVIAERRARPVWGALERGFLTWDGRFMPSTLWMVRFGFGVGFVAAYVTAAACPGLASALVCAGIGLAHAGALLVAEEAATCAQEVA